MDLAGKTYVVTGANTGIGKATAAALGGRGARVVLLCRSAEKAAPVVEELRASTGNASIEAASLDLADLASVRACAAALLARDMPIHALIDNAGLAGTRGLTKDGFELAFGTNHLGHFLLTTLLLERLKESAPSRVVVVASKSHFDAKGIDWDALRRPTASITGLPEYAVSKLANVLFAKELAKKLEGTGVTTYSLHPGVVASDAWRRVPWPIRPLMKLSMITNEQGAATQVWCATAPEIAGESGKYYDDKKERRPSKLALDDDLARELWRRSEAWVAGG